MLNTPLSANLLLSYRCNLHCPYCFENLIRAEKIRELTTEQWCDILDELSEMKVMQLMITGGEIFFHPGIWQILEHAIHCKMRYRLITNGTLINERTVQRLKELGHCDSIQVSLDGPEELHDAARGKGMFKRTVNALHLLADAGFDMRVNTVVTRDNYKRMPEFASFLSSLPILSYRLNPVHGEDDCKQESDECLLTPDELADFIAFFYGKWNQYPKLSIHHGAFVPLAYIQNYYKNIRPDGCIRCSNPKYMISILSDGLIVPCISHRLPAIGYYPQKSIMELWHSPKFDEFRAAVYNGNTLTEKRCINCSYAFYCRRHCPSVPKITYCLKNLRELLIRRGITDL